MLGLQAVRRRYLTEQICLIPSQAELQTARLGVNIVGACALGAVIVAGEFSTTLGKYQV